MARKRQRRRNQVRKRGVFPRFILSARGGYETVWKYRKWTIDVERRSRTEFAWLAYLDDWAHVERAPHEPPCGDFRLFDDKLAGPTGETEQDALWLAKYWIDRWELYWSTWKKNRDGACQLLRAIKMLESRAQRIGESKRKLTRETLAREWQQLDPKAGSGIPGRGAIAWDYFQTLPLKRRLATMDDVVAYTKRASWWEVLPLSEQRRRGGGQLKNRRKRPRKNPQRRAKAIMRSFMRL